LSATNEFLATLIDDIRNDRLILPSLPEIGLKVRSVVQDPSTNASQLAKIISTDPVLSTRLLQVANSVLLRGRNPITNIQNAITRLGNQLVKDLITCLVLQQLYQRGATVFIKKQLRILWDHNSRVAAISHVLARRFTSLPPDQAMLAGLIHDIGVLPILARADTVPELLLDDYALDTVVHHLHTRIGKMVLNTWHFPASLVDVAAEHENLQYNGGRTPTLVDVVIVANLHSHIGSKHRLAAVDWTTVPAFEKLGLTAEESIVSLLEAQGEISEVARLLAA